MRLLLLPLSLLPSVLGSLRDAYERYDKLIQAGRSPEEALEKVVSRTKGYSRKVVENAIGLRVSPAAAFDFAKHEGGGMSPENALRVVAERLGLSEQETKPLIDPPVPGTAEGGAIRGKPASHRGKRDEERHGRRPPEEQQGGGASPQGRQPEGTAHGVAPPGTGREVRRDAPRVTEGSGRPRAPRSQQQQRVTHGSPEALQAERRSREAAIREADPHTRRGAGGEPLQERQPETRRRGGRESQEVPPFPQEAKSRREVEQPELERKAALEAPAPQEQVIGASSRGKGRAERQRGTGPGGRSGASQPAAGPPQQPLTTPDSRGAAEKGQSSRQIPASLEGSRRPERGARGGQPSRQQEAEEESRGADRETLGELKDVLGQLILKLEALMKEVRPLAGA